MEKFKLPDLISSVRTYMLEGEYRYASIEHYEQTWKRLQIYAEKVGAKYFSMDLAMNFLKDCGYDYNDTSHTKPYTRRLYRYIRVLNDYQLHGVVYKHEHQEYHWPETLSEIFEDYLAWRKNQGASDGTVKRSKSNLKHFAQYVTQKVNYFSQLNEMHILEYLNSLCEYNNHTLVNRVDEIRNVLKFAHNNGYHNRDLTSVCPRVKEHKNNRIPLTFTVQEVSELLNSVDRESPVGKRDYVVLLLAAKLGLRSGDIVSLCFENINWELNTIHITQGKTDTPLELPLLDELGWAIIDYLKNGRPATNCQTILVRHNSPYDALAGGTYDIMQKYIRRAKLSIPDGKRHGLHALRHSLASTLLEQNTPLPIISGVLGHLNTDTTKVYLKIAVEQLRQCALEVIL